jgi:phage/plasmid-like protein (TIGR03299 family)
MAHMIETMAYAGATPWHGLGVPVDADIDVDDMLVRAGLDWGVEKVPLHIHRGGAEQMVPGQYALVRDSDDSVLSVVGSTYEPVQNRDAMEFFREFCDAGDMTLETAGSLSGGRRVWALASIRDGFQLAGGDEVSGYLLLTNPHARNEALVAQFTPVRVVCQNTLAMALRGGGSGVFRHRHMAAFDPERARQALGLARDQLAEFHEAATFLSGKRYDLDDVTRFFAATFEPWRAENDDTPVTDLARLPRVAQALDALETQPGADTRAAAGTWWGAVNAVTFLADHRLGRSADTRLASAWYGEARQFKLRALARATELAKAA